MSTSATAGPSAAPIGGRRYGGADPTERQSRRRRALISAGLDVFGSEGYAKASVKSVCDQAGLTQRYFYESFTDRADLLVAVYDDCVDFARTATLAAASPFLDAEADDTEADDTEADDTEDRREPKEVAPARISGSGIAGELISDAARATLRAFMSALTDDERRARVMLVEVVGVSPEIERVRMSAIHGWAELILMLARGSRPPTARQRLASVGLVGAVTQLMVDWYVAGQSDSDIPREPLEDVLDVCVELFVAAHDRLLN
ncbi:MULTISPECIES: TetR/AcrR family transcriptional regulator [Gordonia]|uniref:TetR/AcrR family transcriptional regulator n=1 Tax=Gordonia TaxID=2053 RepID=UPI000425C843|nr:MULTISPECIES: TetR/AcrR family transcriptional regulator [Gordonia]MCR8899379.1 TetR/AcrR family transcriptional regulator [Gordonia sp. GONU]MCZ0915392.1 TetR/AcrR family transcriptional regulator [Gordonia amicalis]MDJ0454355.1 TetR/AcrR family transcriptional regulator [Gordonia amicalis]MDV7077566.1 TetR/AcrR family transcriptional regulator [Gordonia amicalis]UKO92621.1 TetR/AcrR family transcriptional regulator [Gordonia amicalis]